MYMHKEKTADLCSLQKNPSHRKTAIFSGQHDQTIRRHQGIDLFNSSTEFDSAEVVVPHRFHKAGGHLPIGKSGQRVATQNFAMRIHQPAPLQQRNGPGLQCLIGARRLLLDIPHRGRTECRLRQKFLKTGHGLIACDIAGRDSRPWRPAVACVPIPWFNPQKSAHSIGTCGFIDLA